MPSGSTTIARYPASVSSGITARYPNAEPNRPGVEIAVPRPQPPECGRHVMSPRCEPHEGDPAAQQPPGGYGNESAHTGDQEEARETSQRHRAEELGQRISR